MDGELAGAVSQLRDRARGEVVVAAADSTMSSGHDRKRAIRRTALWLALLAAGFYFGFIALGVWHSLR
jgi:hypothetical protein